MQTDPKTDITTHSKYFVYIAMAFVTVMVITDTVVSKLIQVGPFVLPGAIILFPITYIFGDILTEVYGYRASRKVIWSAFVAILFMSFIYWLILLLPPASFWQNQEAFETVFGAVPRIVIAGIIAFFFGELSNSYVLSKMKIWSNGKNLWMRTIGSTVVGEGVDSILFYTIAFVGIISNTELLTLIGSAYLVKVLYEVLATPLTYYIVNKLKKTEGIDVYDRGINYNPFIFGGQ